MSSLSSSSTNMNNIINILKCASNVVSAEAHIFEHDDEVQDFSLEPTPIAPGGVNMVVPQVPVSSLVGWTNGLDNLFSFEFNPSKIRAHHEHSFLMTMPIPCDEVALSAGTVNSIGPYITQSSSAVPNLPKRSRKFQTGQWKERFQELLSFREEHGHLFVPHSYPRNQQLAQWVKR